MTLISNNLKFLRKRNHWTQEQCADHLGIKRSLLGAYEEGRADPPLENLLKIAEVFHLSVDELVVTDLSRISSQTFEGKETGEPTLKILSITVDSNDQENIELVQQKAAAGYLNGYADPDYIESLPRFRLPMLPDGGTYRAFEISGDSMLPINPGTVIIGQYLEKLSDMKDGRTYIVVTQNEGLVYKRVYNRITEDKSLEMVSDNANYSSYRVPAGEVLEIWEARAFISSQFPDPSAKPEMSMERLAGMVLDLQNQVARLKQ